MSRQFGPFPFILVTALAVGCTGPDPTPEELEIAFEDEALGLEVVSIPTARAQAEAPEPEPPAEVALFPAGRPHVGFADLTHCDTQDDEGCVEGVGSCPFAIDTEGFPAISQDGTEIVTFEYQGSSGADMDVGNYHIVWRTVADDRVLRTQTLANGSDTGEKTEWGADLDLCGDEADEARRVVMHVDAELREGWRSLPALAVQVPTPEWMLFNFDEEELAEHQAPRPAARRPVEAFHRNGYFLMRVEGVEVLHKEVRTDWLGVSPELSMNAYVPNISGLFGDAASGVAVVAMNYESGSCMSDADDVYHVVELAPEVFEAIERRAGNVHALALGDE